VLSISAGSARPPTWRRDLLLGIDQRKADPERIPRAGRLARIVDRIERPMSTNFARPTFSRE